MKTTLLLALISAAAAASAPVLGFEMALALFSVGGLLTIAAADYGRSLQSWQVATEADAATPSTHGSSLRLAA